MESKSEKNSTNVPIRKFDNRDKNNTIVEHTTMQKYEMKFSNGSQYHTAGNSPLKDPNQIFSGEASIVSTSQSKGNRKALVGSMIVGGNKRVPKVANSSPLRDPIPMKMHVREFSE